MKIEGLPSWVSSERYTIEAKANGNPGLGMMMGPMLQALLEDRFALKIHSETREAPAYALTAAKGGLKMPPFQGTCTPRDSATPLAPPGQNDCRPIAQRQASNVIYDDPARDLDSIAFYLGTFSGLEAPVINRTSIPGLFHFHIEYASNARQGDRGYVPPTDDAPFPSIFTAVQRQLGLKLDATKAPRQFLVVDHLERPSSN